MKHDVALTEAEISQIDARVLVVDDNRELWHNYDEVLALQRSPVSEELQQLVRTVFDYKEHEVHDNYLFNSITLDYSHTATDANNKIDAAYVNGKPYHVIFIDVQMPPDVDGITATRQIWEKHPEQQIILCTAYSKYTFAEINKVLQSRRHNLLMMRKPFDAESVRLITQSQIINAELVWRQAFSSGKNND